MTDLETISAYDAQISAYAEMATHSTEPDASLQSFIDLVVPGGLILDLGCGTGNASVAMRDHGFSIEALDASAEMVRHANETYNIGARQALFCEIDSSNVYDGIWANFSLLHASKSEFPEILKALAQALKPAAIIHLAMKLGEGSKRDRLGRLYSYYSEAELTDHLAASGFDTHSVSHDSGPGLAGDVEAWIMMLGRNNKYPV